MKRQRIWLCLFLLGFLALWLASCAPAATPTGAPAAPAATTVVTQAAATPTVAPLPTQPAAPALTPTPAVDMRGIELEWPARLRLGESDIIRLSLVPYKDGYAVKAEFPDHQVRSQPLSLKNIPGYTLVGIARLDGVGFDIAPVGDQESTLPLGEEVSWHWTFSGRASGQQRLSVSLTLKWLPEGGLKAPVRDSLAFSRGIDVQVTSFLGLTQPQAMATGILGLFFSGGSFLFAFVFKSRPPRTVMQSLAPNYSLAIEPKPGLPPVTYVETDLLRTLFHAYSRLVIENEFQSGYSGARSLLVLPVQPGGRVDAYTIVKIGQQDSIQREFDNYELYVKDSLPPITARIQHQPVRSRRANKAALRYTFIAEPGHLPVSLRQALLQNPDPALLDKLFETFGPQWWMQRQPCVFRLSKEYDRLLPPHYVLEPVRNTAKASAGITEQDSPGNVRLNIDDLVEVNRFSTVERRADEVSYTVLGKPVAGQAALRLRWLSPIKPEHGAARVVATRQSLLCGFVDGFDRLGLPDPLNYLDTILNENVLGTQSIIHGDLNLENLLVGPGNFVWLIDFAETRLGHPLFDFAHLASEIISQVLAVQINSPEEYLHRLQEGYPLLQKIEAIASRCLFNSSQKREYLLAFYLSNIGALKFTNLTPFKKQLLYLTAASLAQELS
ncbi:MAG: phosphotransferase [Anaerolineaceae bacterium]|nr:phosphotransferase [Anaerolineaceae bacterium]